ncbi:hypothetical protein R3W88_023584 [Solanum pinnatisectum]|uniref:S-protein homolog n=1 Tax=Solanum pinnatisectum TaxID=50273 RepID=A0AAV9LY54_9SOLN|nr:hypothetical protein R3W88_023584 [Solanum pinnatisectum]
MVNFKIKFSFCSFIFLLNFGLSSCKSPFSTIYTVYIIDALPSNSKPLTVRCQSKDDDLGYKNLYPGGEYHFSFKENFLGGTLFFCHFWWNGKNIIFDVFDNKIDIYCGEVELLSNDRNHECFWKVQEDGFYFAPHRNPPSIYEKKHDWPTALV